MKLHDVDQFWSVAKRFRERKARWIPRAGYELREVVHVAGMPWAASLNVHVIGEVDDKALKGVGVRFEACVMLWPPKLTNAEEARLSRRGWYTATKRALVESGYKGAWNRDVNGKWGYFTKLLATSADASREGKTLEKLPALLGLGTDQKQK